MSKSGSRFCVTYSLHMKSIFYDECVGVCSTQVVCYHPTRCNACSTYEHIQDFTLYIFYGLKTLLCTTKLHMGMKTYIDLTIWNRTKPRPGDPLWAQGKSMQHHPVTSQAMQTGQSSADINHICVKSWLNA